MEASFAQVLVQSQSIYFNLHQSESNLVPTTCTKTLVPSTWSNICPRGLGPKRPGAARAVRASRAPAACRRRGAWGRPGLEGPGSGGDRPQRVPEEDLLLVQADELLLDPEQRFGFIVSFTKQITRCGRDLMRRHKMGR